MTSVIASVSSPPPDGVERRPPEGHVGAHAERRQRPERALRPGLGEGLPDEATALAVAANLFKQVLNRVIQPGGKDYARDTADSFLLGEGARYAGQPVLIRLVVIVEEGDDVARRGGDARVA